MSSKTQQKIDDLKAMLSTGLVTDPEIVQATNDEIDRLLKVRQKETQAAMDKAQVEIKNIVDQSGAPKDKVVISKKEKPISKPAPKKRGPKASRKDAAYDWKKKVDLKTLKPVVIHCQHYQLPVEKEMDVKLKGTGNRSNLVTAKPGEHLIFDDQGHLVFVMGKDSFKEKCVEKRTVKEHEAEKHKSKVTNVTNVTKKPKAKPAAKPKAKPAAKPKAKPAAKPKKGTAAVSNRIKEAVGKKDVSKIRELLKKGENENKELSRAEVIRLGKMVRPVLQSKRGISQDNPNKNRKRLEPTYNNLLRWSESPGQYDLIGVDVAKSSKPTVKAKPVKKAKILSLFKL